MRLSTVSLPDKLKSVQTFSTLRPGDCTVAEKTKREMSGTMGEGSSQEMNKNENVIEHEHGQEFRENSEEKKEISKEINDGADEFTQDTKDTGSEVEKDISQEKKTKTPEKGIQQLKTLEGNNSDNIPEGIDNESSQSSNNMEIEAGKNISQKKCSKDGIEIKQFKNAKKQNIDQGSEEPEHFENICGEILAEMMNMVEEIDTTGKGGDEKSDDKKNLEHYHIELKDSSPNSDHVGYSTCIRENSEEIREQKQSDKKVGSESLQQRSPELSMSPSAELERITDNESQTSDTVEEKPGESVENEIKGEICNEDKVVKNEEGDIGADNDASTKKISDKSKETIATFPFEESSYNGLHGSVDEEPVDTFSDRGENEEIDEMKISKNPENRKKVNAIYTTANSNSREPGHILWSRRVSDPTLRYWNVRDLLGKVSKHVSPALSSYHSAQEKTASLQHPEQLDILSADSPGVKSLFHLAVSVRKNGSKKRAKITDFTQLLQSKGIRMTDPRLLATCNMIMKEAKGDKTELLQEVFTRICSPNFDFIRKALLNQLTIPGFDFFKRRMSRVFDSVSSILLKLDKPTSDGGRNPNSGYQSFMLNRRTSKDRTFCMSICTVDGQRLSFGNKDTLHPLNSCANVLNYSIACKQNGIETVQSYVGALPIGESKDEFTMDAKGRVWNPFTKAGAIMTSALLLRGGESTDERLTSLHETYSKTMAGEPVWCDNLSYNLKRLYEHEEISLAYFLSARQKLPKFHALTPGDALELNFQSSSTATSCDTCSIAAATLAAGGTCPLTGELVFKKEIVHQTLETMRSSDTLKLVQDVKNGISHVWSENGCIFLVVPGVMGISCFAQCQPVHVMEELVKCLVQNLLSTFNFSLYRSLKSGKPDSARSKPLQVV